MEKRAEGARPDRRRTAPPQGRNPFPGSGRRPVLRRRIPVPAFSVPRSRSFGGSARSRACRGRVPGTAEKNDAGVGSRRAGCKLLAVRAMNFMHGLPGSLRPGNAGKKDRPLYAYTGARVRPFLRLSCRRPATRIRRRGPPTAARFPWSRDFPPPARLPPRVALLVGGGAGTACRRPSCRPARRGGLASEGGGAGSRPLSSPERRGGFARGGQSGAGKRGGIRGARRERIRRRSRCATLSSCRLLSVGCPQGLCRQANAERNPLRHRAVNSGRGRGEAYGDGLAASDAVAERLGAESAKTAFPAWKIRSFPYPNRGKEN